MTLQRHRREQHLHFAQDDSRELRADEGCGATSRSTSPYEDYSGAWVRGTTGEAIGKSDAHVSPSVGAPGRTFEVTGIRRGLAVSRDAMRVTERPVLFDNERWFGFPAFR